jgi:3-phenylpropionate/trans-cinnamate dioxygenase ferredoxin reductase component
MTNYDYLIIGGGMTAAAAVDGIREVDPTGGIGMISTEPDPPYNRPPLSKALWKGKPLDSIWRKPKNNLLDVHLSRVIKEIVSEEKRVVDATGDVFTYEKLLLATGGRPRRLPFGDDQIIYFRTLSDYRRLRALTETGRWFAVIGGGFIGAEIAAALAMNGKEVVMIFPEQNIGERVFPRDLSQYVSGFYKQKGVEVLAGEKIVALEARGNQRVLTTATRGQILVDGVVAGVGIEPNIELALSAGLKTDNGIIVDEFLRTRDPDIYAAGDVASFYSPALGTRLRVEHEDNANSMGRSAGRNMAGLNEPYNHLPSFYSDMFELGYEAVGEVDSRLETFADWKRPNEEGVVYYLKNRRVRGVLLWNVWGQVNAARDLIAESGPFTAKDLEGRLPAKTLAQKGEAVEGAASVGTETAPAYG